MAETTTSLVEAGGGRRANQDSFPVSITSKS